MNNLELAAKEVGWAYSNPTSSDVRFIFSPTPIVESPKALGMRVQKGGECLIYFIFYGNNRSEYEPKIKVDVAWSKEHTVERVWVETIRFVLKEKKHLPAYPPSSRIIYQRSREPDLEAYANRPVCSAAGGGEMFRTTFSINDLPPKEKTTEITQGFVPTSIRRICVSTSTGVVMHSAPLVVSMGEYRTAKGLEDLKGPSFSSKAHYISPKSFAESLEDFVKQQQGLSSYIDSLGVRKGDPQSSKQAQDAAKQYLSGLSVVEAKEPSSIPRDSGPVKFAGSSLLTTGMALWAANNASHATPEYTYGHVLFPIGYPEHEKTKAFADLGNDLSEVGLEKFVKKGYAYVKYGKKFIVAYLNWWKKMDLLPLKDGVVHMLSLDSYQPYVSLTKLSQTLAGFALALAATKFEEDLRDEKGVERFFAITKGVSASEDVDSLPNPLPVLPPPQRGNVDQIPEYRRNVPLPNESSNHQVSMRNYTSTPLQDSVGLLGLNYYPGTRNNGPPMLLSLTQNDGPVEEVGHPADTDIGSVRFDGAYDDHSTVPGLLGTISVVSEPGSMLTKKDSDLNQICDDLFTDTERNAVRVAAGMNLGKIPGYREPPRSLRSSVNGGLPLRQMQDSQPNEYYFPGDELLDLEGVEVLDMPNSTFPAPTCVRLSNSKTNGIRFLSPVNVPRDRPLVLVEFRQSYVPRTERERDFFLDNDLMYKSIKQGERDEYYCLLGFGGYEMNGPFYESPPFRLPKDTGLRLLEVRETHFGKGVFAVGDIIENLDLGNYGMLENRELFSDERISKKKMKEASFQEAEYTFKIKEKFVSAKSGEFIHWTGLVNYGHPGNIQVLDKKEGDVYTGRLQTRQPIQARSELTLDYGADYLVGQAEEGVEWAFEALKAHPERDIFLKRSRDVNLKAWIRGSELR